MILKLANGRYVDSESYGIFSWGSLSQTSLVKKNNQWVISTSYCTDSTEDIWKTEEVPIKVVEELKNIPEGIVLYNQDEHDTLKTFYNEIFEKCYKEIFEEDKGGQF